MLRSPLLAILLAIPCAAWAHGGATLERESIEAQLIASPHEPELLLRRAELLRLEGRVGAALDQLLMLEAVAPRLTALPLERAQCLLALGEELGAELELDRLLREGPPSAAAHELRASLRLGRGDAQEAIADLQAAVALRSTVERVLRLGELQAASGALDAAAQTFAAGIARHAGAIVLRDALAKVEASRGHVDSALAQVNAVLPTLAVKTEWLLLRAELLEQAGRTEAAREAAAAALAEAEAHLDKRPSASARTARARALLLLGRSDDAVLELERALAHRSLPKAAELLAQARARRGEDP